MFTGDNAEIFFPQFISAGIDGIGSTWNRFAAAGTDKVTEGASTLPNLWFYTALPAWLAQQIVVIAMVTAAVIGGYALCRRTLGTSFWPAVLGGVGCAALPYGMLVYNAQAWTPALIAATAFALDAPRRPWRWLLVLVPVLVIGQTTYLSRILPWPSVALVGWFLFVDRKRPLAAWLAILVIAIAIVALRVGELRAFMDIARLSHAGLVRWQAGMGEVIDSALALSAITGNVLTIACTILLALGLAVGRGRKAHGIGLGVMILAGLLAPIAAVAVQLALLEHVPQLYGYELRRFGILAGVALPFAGAWGLQALLNRPLAPRLGATLVVGCLGAALVVNLQQKTDSLKDWVSQGNYVQNFQSPVIAQLAGQVQAGPPLRVESFQIYPTYLHAYGLETLGGYQPIFFRRYYDFWAAMVEPWAASLPPDHGAWGDPAKELVKRGGPAFRGDRLMLSPDSHRSDWQLGELYRMNLLSLANVGLLVSRDRLHAPGLEEVRAAPRPWSELSVKDKVLISLRANFHGREHLYVYRNTKVLPRFFAVERVRLLADGPATLRAMAAAPVDELATTAFLAVADADGVVTDGERFAPSTIALRHYGGDTVELAVSGDGEGFLVVTNAYTPSWTVSIDGQPARLLPADHVFWGVRLPSGAHVVKFRYQPRH